MTPFLFLIIIVASLGLLLSQYEPRHNEEPDRHQRNGQAKQEVGVGVPTQPGEIATAAENEDAAEKKEENYAWLYDGSGNTIATWALVIIGIAASVLTLRTLGTLEKQTKATEDSATASKNAVIAADKNFITGQRAYVFMEDIQSPALLGPHLPFELRLFIKNYGLTPAKDVRISTRLDITTGPIQPPDTHGPNGSAMTLGGGQAAPHLPIFLGNIPGKTLTEEQWKLITIAQTHRLRLAIRIDYKDVFGKGHFTTICQSYPILVTRPFRAEGNTFMVDGGDCNQSD